MFFCEIANDFPIIQLVIDFNLGNHSKTINHLLELISEFSEVAEHKDHIKNQLYVYIWPLCSRTSLNSLLVLVNNLQIWSDVIDLIMSRQFWFIFFNRYDFF